MVEIIHDMIVRCDNCLKDLKFNEDDIKDCCIKCPECGNYIKVC